MYCLLILPQAACRTPTQIPEVEFLQDVVIETVALEKRGFLLHICAEQPVVLETLQGFSV